MVQAVVDLLPLGRRHAAVGLDDQPLLEHADPAARHAVVRIESAGHLQHRAAHAVVGAGEHDGIVEARAVRLLADLQALREPGGPGIEIQGIERPAEKVGLLFGKPSAQGRQVVRRQEGVVIQIEQEFVARRSRPGVAGVAQALTPLKQVDEGGIGLGQAPGEGGGAVARVVVDDDDLERIVDGQLRPDGVDQLPQERKAVVGADQHRHACVIGLCVRLARHGRLPATAWRRLRAWTRFMSIGLSLIGDRLSPVQGRERPTPFVAA